MMKLTVENQYSFQKAMGYPEDPETMTASEFRAQVRLWLGEVRAAEEGRKGCGLAIDELCQLEAFLENIATAEIEYEKPLVTHNYHVGFEYYANFSVEAETDEQADARARKRFAAMAAAMPTLLYGMEGRFDYLEQDEYGRSARLVEKEV